MCTWLKQKGSSDLINVPGPPTATTTNAHARTAMHRRPRTTTRTALTTLTILHVFPSPADTGGFSPLFWSVFYNRIDTALWMIAHGADPCIITANQNATILAIACQYSSPSFVAELASRVPGHIALTDAQDLSPMHYALMGNKVSIMKLLVLLGVPIRRQDFPSSIPGFVAFDLLEPRNELRSWVEDEVRVHNMFITLVLGCGVHHRDAKEKQTKRRYSTTGTSASCQLAKLRSGALTEVRMMLAACLGVRTSAAEIRRLRYAREELRALPAHPRVRPPSPQR